jgi:hypothetical protein
VRKAEPVSDLAVPAKIPRAATDNLANRESGEILKFGKRKHLYASQFICMCNNMPISGYLPLPVFLQIFADLLRYCYPALGPVQRLNVTIDIPSES